MPRLFMPDLIFSFWCIAPLSPFFIIIPSHPTNKYGSLYLNCIDILPYTTSTYLILGVISFLLCLEGIFRCSRSFVLFLSFIFRRGKRLFI